MPVVETLGGALFGAVLQVLFDKLDSRQVLDYFRGRKLDEKLLKKLKRKLRDINDVIDDAEQKQFSNSNVKAWLDEVRDALLDAEDLLDEINYEFSKCQMEAEFQTSASKVRSFESRMIDVLDDLKSLLKQKVVQGLEIASGVGVGSGSGSKVLKVLPQTSLVAEGVIYGRDDDKEMILNWLTSDIDNPSQLSILSIVGMVLNSGPQPQLWPQYCCCGGVRNRIGPQLWCDFQSHKIPQHSRNGTASEPQ